MKRRMKLCIYITCTSALMLLILFNIFIDNNDVTTDTIDYEYFEKLESLLDEINHLINTEKEIYSQDLLDDLTKKLEEFEKVKSQAIDIYGHDLPQHLTDKILKIQQLYDQLQIELDNIDEILLTDKSKIAKTIYIFSNISRKNKTFYLDLFEKIKQTEYKIKNVYPNSSQIPHTLKIRLIALRAKIIEISNLINNVEHNTFNKPNNRKRLFPFIKCAYEPTV